MTSGNPIVHILGHCSSSHEGDCWYWETSEKRRNSNKGSVWFEEQQQQAIEAYIAERPSAEAFIEWGWGKRCKTTDKEDFPEIEHDPLANRCANCEMWEHFDEWKSQLKSNERVN